MHMRLLDRRVGVTARRMLQMLRLCEDTGYFPCAAQLGIRFPRARNPGDQR